jgi:hypothetical protein
MTTVYRPVCFPLPYTSPPTPWEDLSQHMRDAWVGWAAANPVGATDYKHIIRPGPTAYALITTQDMAANGGSTSIAYPPEALPPSEQTLHKRFATATSADLLSLCTARLLSAGETWLIWASAPAASLANIDPATIEFISKTDAPASTPQNDFFQDIAASYVSVHGSLAGHTGDTLLLFAFAIQNGSLHNAGSWVVTVGEISPYATQAYWPCDEAAGTRYSAAPPHNLVPIGPVPYNAGIIAGGILLDPATTGYLALETPGELSPDAQPFTFALWFNLTSVAANNSLAGIASGTTPATIEWRSLHRRKLSPQRGRMAPRSRRLRSLGALHLDQPRRRSPNHNPWHRHPAARHPCLRDRAANRRLPPAVRHPLRAHNLEPHTPRSRARRPLRSRRRRRLALPALSGRASYKAIRRLD